MSNKVRLRFPSPSLLDLKEAAGKRLGKFCLFCFCPLQGYQQKLCCTAPKCDTEYQAVYKRDYRKDVFQLLTPTEKKKMALDDAGEAKLNEELAKTKAQLADLLDKVKQDENHAKESEQKRKKEKVGGPATDPDTLKEIAELKAKVAKLEEAKSSGAGSDNFHLNFFENF